MQPTPHLITILILALVGGGFAFAANMISMTMVDQINEKLPEGERLSPLRWGSRITRQHREFFPNSKLVIPYYLCAVCMCMCFIAAGWIGIAAAHFGR
jgi:hypothetical protein